jgi:membrane associated rhomboid family serine protease
MATMIPLKDETRQPLHYPYVTLSLILANSIVFLLELQGGQDFVAKWSAVPAEIMAGHRWITLLTSMFMHGGWLHIIGNMVFLWAFGREIEDAMNPVRYIIFYLLGGLVSMTAQILASPTSTIPNLGASGAIAAVMGAFIITYPRDKIKTLVVIFFFVSTPMIPAAALIGIWFLIQVFSVGSVASVQTGGVAYMAHVGGFIFGVIFGRLFEDRRRLVEEGLIQQ